MKHIWRLFELALVLSCGALAQTQTVQPTDPRPAPSLLVSGRAVLWPPSHGAGERHNTVTFTSDVHAVVALYHLSGNTPGKVVARTSVKGLRHIPFSFRLEGNPRRVFAAPAGDYGSESFYALDITVYTGSENVVAPSGAGKYFGVGDFVTANVTVNGDNERSQLERETLLEFPEVLYGPTARVRVELTQLMAPGQATPTPFPP